MPVLKRIKGMGIPVNLGNRTFALMAIRRQDLKGFVKLRSARTKAQLEQAKLAVQEKVQEASRRREERRMERSSSAPKIAAAINASGQAGQTMGISPGNGGSGGGGSGGGRGGGGGRGMTWEILSVKEGASRGPT